MKVRVTAGCRAILARLGVDGERRKDDGRSTKWLGMGEGEVLLVTPTQWASAKTLGAAGRFADEGKTVEARAALVQVQFAPSLSGYADLVRIRILMTRHVPM